MNKFQQNLYNDLMALCESNEAFYYKDFEVDDSQYRIFNYRLASYTDFLVPGALECRGVMYEIDEDKNAVRLASLPMEKFFNLNENPMTMDLDLSTVKSVELKADGSLISTYFHADSEQNGLGKLMLKSKGSTESDQCIAALEWLKRPENDEFYRALHLLAAADQTVNLEWCAPDNRVVISYAEPILTVLNVRSHVDGRYQPREFVEQVVGSVIGEYWISEIDIEDPVSFVAGIPQMEGVEGYVVELESGQRIKVKTEWYLVQHRAKDSINSPRRLFEACIEEATDDLRSLFYDDPLVIARIEEMEQFAEKIYNHTVDQVERFYERNKDLERKDYAILGQKELDTRIFGLAMSKYLGREVDYKAFMRKNYKEFGVADDPINGVE